MAGVVTVAMTACNSTASRSWSDVAIDNARIQMGMQIDTVEKLGLPFHNPTSILEDGNVLYCDVTDWRSGFFPGAVWYLYELTGDSTLVPYARKYTEAVADAQYLKWHHDVGFMVGSSFGNGYRLTSDSSYADAVVEAARSQKSHTPDLRSADYPLHYARMSDISVSCISSWKHNILPSNLSHRSH